jgi:VWFA-related protein
MNTMKNRLRFNPAKSLVMVAVLAGMNFLGAFPAAAQSPAGPIPPKSGARVEQSPDSPNIRVKVDLVNTPVVVDDAKGGMILDLTQKNFRLFDNGIEQKIEAFDMGGTPLSVAIVVETSSRIEALLPAIRKTGILFTQTVLGPEGDATVIGYNDSVDQLLDFTTNRDTIEKTFTDLKEGTSGAKLYDALSLAVGRLRNRPTTRRRVLIVVAEAADSGSENKLGQVLREAQLANITVYSVALSATAAALRGPEKQAAPPSATPPGTFGLPPIPGAPQTPENEETRSGNIDLLGLATWTVQHATASVREHPLEIATAATGGLYQTAFRDSTIETAIDRIGGELHAEYTLSYHPTGTDPAGYHEIKVQVDRPGVKVRSRPGYYL